MPLDNTGWTPTSAGDRIAQQRAIMDEAAGQPLDYSPGSWEGAQTTAAGVMAFRVESDAAVLLDALSPETAAGANLDRIGEFRGIPRRAATYSRYIVYPVFGPNNTQANIPAGTIFRDPDRNQWQTVETTSGAVFDTPITAEAVDSGAITMPAGSPYTMNLVTPVAGLTGFIFDVADGDPFSIGRPRESDSQYRVRLRQTLSLGIGASSPGVRTALLQLDWVEAVDVTRTSPGIISIYIIPAPVGTDQETQLGEAILESVAGGLATTGTDFTTVSVAGVTDVVYWTPGTELPITVDITITPLTGFTVAQLTPAVTDAITGVFNALPRGGALRRLQILGALSPINGLGAVVTLLFNGSNVDVQPLSTQIIVLDGTPVVT